MYAYACFHLLPNDCKTRHTELKSIINSDCLDSGTLSLICIALNKWVMFYVIPNLGPKVPLFLYNFNSCLLFKKWLSIRLVKPGVLGADETGGTHGLGNVAEEKIKKCSTSRLQEHHIRTHGHQTTTFVHLPWSTLGIHSTHPFQELIQKSITRVVWIPESLELTRWHSGLLHPLGHCSANKPSALIWTHYLTTFS